MYIEYTYYTIVCNIYTYVCTCVLTSTCALCVKMHMKVRGFVVFSPLL